MQSAAASKLYPSVSQMLTSSSALMASKSFRDMTIRMTGPGGSFGPEAAEPSELSAQAVVGRSHWSASGRAFDKPLWRASMP